MIKNTQEAREILEEAVEYSGGLAEMSETGLDDMITELADTNVDVYTADLYKWAGTNEGYTYTDRAIDEFGWDGVGGELDKAYMMGQYVRNTELLYEALKEMEAIDQL